MYADWHSTRRPLSEVIQCCAAAAFLHDRPEADSRAAALRQPRRRSVDTFVAPIPGVDHNHDTVEDRLVEVFDGRAVALIVFSVHTSYREVFRRRPAYFHDFTTSTDFG